jgi:hypothetical protein
MLTTACLREREQPLRNLRVRESPTSIPGVREPVALQYNGSDGR